ncbi:MAG: HAMP domain-containing histidine kinase [Actinomycetota bacterium]|nr:HAMP domain-containing histidine kinase [Actinomycetota bacterium]
MAEGAPHLLTKLRDGWGTVRVRTTAAATIVVGVALLVAAVAMVVLLRRSLTADVGAAAALQAEAAVTGLASGPADGAIPIGDGEEEFVQVLDATGRVVASSANLTGTSAIVELAPGETRRIANVTNADRPLEDGPWLAVARSASTSRGSLTVVSGRTLETVTESTQAVTALLGSGVPLLLLVVGAVTWHVVGRALAPVEAMRTQVNAISTSDLDRRVPTSSGTDEIARLGTTMNQMLARLEQGQERQRRFVSDASHELRSPVTTIRQQAEVALAHPDGITIAELAGVVLQEDIRLQNLVEDLLLLAKIDEGTLRLRREPVDLDDLVLAEAGRLRTTTDRRVDTGGVSAGRVSGDGGQLYRLVHNLIDNAARHCLGAVALSLGEREGKVVFAVDDDGGGVPPSDRHRILERFVRLDDARDRDSGGSGLGLAIVAEVAGAHGATVSVLDSPLGGARFEVRFPAAAG